MSPAELYVAMCAKADSSTTWLGAEAWDTAAGEIGLREERAGRGEEFWSAVDRIEQENK